MCVLVSLCVCVFACCASGAVWLRICLPQLQLCHMSASGTSYGLWSPVSGPETWPGTWPKQNLFKLRPGIKIARLS